MTFCQYSATPGDTCYCNIACEGISRTSVWHLMFRYNCDIKVAEIRNGYSM